MFDIVISNATVVTMDSARRIIKRGAVAIEGQQIVGIGKSQELDKEPSDTKIDAEGDLVLPGFIDVHSHVQSAVASLRGYGLEAPVRAAYPRWWRQMMVRRNVSDEDRYYLGMGGCLLDLRFGTTTLADWDFGEDAIAKAVRDLGLRGFLGEYLYGIDFLKTQDGIYVFSSDDAKRTLKAGLKLVDNWNDQADGRISCFLGPLAPDTCPPQFLGEIKREADIRSLRITTHLAQSQGELKFIKEEYSASPVDYMRDLLGQNTWVAHCNYITDEGIRVLKETQTKVGLCPHVYAREGESTPLAKFLGQGCIVGLGTDGAPDMIRNMEMAMVAAYFRRGFLSEPDPPNSQKVLELATIGGAKVLGKDREIGSLEVGKKADIIIIDMNKPHLVPNVDPVANLVYYGNGNDVKTVIIDGKIVMENRTIKTVDEEPILQKTQEAALNAWSKFYSEERLFADT